MSQENVMNIKDKCNVSEKVVDLRAPILLKVKISP